MSQKNTDVNEQVEHVIRTALARQNIPYPKPLDHIAREWGGVMVFESDRTSDELHNASADADAKSAVIERIGGPRVPPAVGDLDTESLVNEHIMAQLLGESPLLLRHWRRTGIGPAWHRLGSKIVYSVEDVQAWLASRRFQSTAEADAAAR